MGRLVSRYIPKSRYTHSCRPLQPSAIYVRSSCSSSLTQNSAKRLLDFSSSVANCSPVASKSLRLGEETLARVGKSAPEDQFVTNDGRIVWPNETPVLELRYPGSTWLGEAVARHPREELGPVAVYACMGRGRSAVSATIISSILVLTSIISRQVNCIREGDDTEAKNIREKVRTLRDGL
jgi:hypothetical protein